METDFDNETTVIAVAASLDSSAAVMGWAWADSHGDSGSGTMTGKNPRDALRAAILDALPRHPAGRLDIVTTHAALRRSLTPAAQGAPLEGADRSIAQQAAARPADVVFRAPDAEDDDIEHRARQIATEQRKARTSQSSQPPADTPRLLREAEAGGIVCTDDKPMDTPRLLREAEGNLRATADALRALAHELLAHETDGRSDG